LAAVSQASFHAPMRERKSSLARSGRASRGRRSSASAMLASAERPLLAAAVGVEARHAHAREQVQRLGSRSRSSQVVSSSSAARELVGVDQHLAQLAPQRGARRLGQLAAQLGDLGLALGATRALMEALELLVVGEGREALDARALGVQRAAEERVLLGERQVRVRRGVGGQLPAQRRRRRRTAVG
jgi:hypothetical protein